VPVAVFLLAGSRVEVTTMVGIMIGIDPHKRSHTAVAVDEGEHLLGQLRV
jgi:hypothetical protein